MGSGRTGPLTKLHVVSTGTGIQEQLYLGNNQAPAANVGDAILFVGNTPGTTTMGEIISAWNGAAATDSYMSFKTRGGDTRNEVMRLTSTGNVGINTTGPDARLDSLATSGEQLRLTYTDGSVYSGFTVNSSGDLNIDGTGNDITTPDRVTIGSATAGVGKLNVTGSEVGKALAIFNETGDQNILTASASGTTVANLDRSGNLSIEGAINDISGNLVLNDTVDIGSATTGLNVTTAGLITDTDGNVVIGDTIDLGSATTGVNVTTAGAISDTDANLVLNDTVDLGSASTGLNITTAGAISDIDGAISLNDDTNIIGDLDISSQLALGDNASITANEIASITDTSIDINVASTTGINLAQTLTGATGSGTYYGIKNDLTDSSSSTSNTGHVLNYSSLTNNNASVGSASSWFANQSYVTNLAAATISNTYNYFAETDHAGSTTIGGTASSNFYSKFNNAAFGTISNAYNFYATSPVNTFGTISNIYGLYVADQSVGTNTTAYGVYIDNQAGSSGNAIGLYIADADDYSIQLASADGDAASGITFGTDTNLYRNAANQLHTDDSFDIDGNLITDGNTTLGNASGDTVTANADAWTFANDTTIALTGGLNGLNIDSNTLSIDAASNFVGIGTAAPAAILDVIKGGVSGATPYSSIASFQSNAAAYVSILTPTNSENGVLFGQAWSNVAGGILYDTSAVDQGFEFRNNGNAFKMALTSGGNLGVGTSGPDARIDSLATSGEQLRLTYTDGSVYSGFTVNSGGDLTIDGTGDDIMTTDRLTLGSGTAGVAKLTVTGAETGKALAIFNETGDQNPLVASVSGTLAFAITNSGDISKGDKDGVNALPDSGTLVPNGSFEANSDGVGIPDGWTSITGSFSTTTTSIHGENALNEPAAAEIVGMCFPIAGDATRTYDLSVWSRGVSSGQSLKIYGDGYGSKANCVSRTTRNQVEIINTSNTTSYTAYTGTYTPGSSDKWVRINIQNPSSYIDGILLRQTTTISGLDIAETYPTNPDEKLEPGHVVAFGTDAQQNGADVKNVIKTSRVYDRNAFGVVTTQPGIVLDDEKQYEKVQVALKGRVPVLVTTENGPVKIGDPITASSIPGVGMKATRSGKIVGYAMTEYTNPDPHAIDQVTVFINPEMYIDLSILTDVKQATLDVLQAATVTTQRLIAGSIQVGTATIDSLIVDRLVSNDIQTSTLTSKKVVAEKTETTSLTSETLKTKDASVSGTLVADQVDSKNIRELRERLENIALDQTGVKVDSKQLNSELKNIQGYIDELTNSQPADQVADTETYQIVQQDIPVDPGSVESLSGELIPAANIEKLTVTGTASMASLTVADAFSAGQLYAQNDSLISMADELKLGALERISLMNGGVIIAKDGTITAKGEIIAERGIRTNTIKAVSGGDVSVVLGADGTATPSAFTIADAQGTSVASINASGSAKFADLSLETYTDATSSAVVASARDTYHETGIYAPSITTNAAASGNGILPESQNDIVIFNNKITPKSVINLTATSSTQNQSLYVDKVVTCTTATERTGCKPYFRVALDKALDVDVKFNWLVVN